MKVARKEKFRQMKEPLALLETFRNEGLSNLLSLSGMASGFAAGAVNNIGISSAKPMLFEAMRSLGFVVTEDLEKLETRLENLEQKLAEMEYSKLVDEEE